MRIRIGFVLIVATLGGRALAAPFTVAYEGNDFPENEGWRRRTTAGGAIRSIEDGQLVLDGRSNVEISDFYERRDGSIALDPGEQFFVEWRFSLEDHSGPIGDGSLNITTDDGYWVTINISPTRIRFGLTDEQIEFAFDGSVSFRLESDDLRSFSLFANGSLIHAGHFRPLIGLGPRVSWGDGTQGVSSLSRWDYFRFGVVPEPRSCVGGIFGLIYLLRRR